MRAAVFAEVIRLRVDGSIILHTEKEASLEASLAEMARKPRTALFSAASPGNINDA